MSLKPDFFIVGAPKCGTSAMHDLLRQHPCIFMPDIKEPCYFGRDTGVIPAVSTKEAYLELFRPGTDKCKGEASTPYLASRTAAAEIHAFNPRAKIIIMLRDPVSFLQSYHNQQVYEGNETIIDFERALAAEADRRENLDAVKAPRPRALLYREAAKFSSQVERYFDQFGRDAVLVILYDDFRADAVREAQHVFAFLGVDASFTPQVRDVHVRPRVRFGFVQRVLVNETIRKAGKKLLPEAFTTRLGNAAVRMNTVVGDRLEVSMDVQCTIIDDLRDDVQRLGTLIDRDLSAWLEP